MVALAMVLGACGGESRGSPPPVQLTDPERHALHVGLEEPGSANVALGQVVAARLTSGGGHVVVLDFVAPYVKVFDRAGRLQAAFAGAGGGPGEARHPTALAVSGDSLVLVADGLIGIAVYDLRGNLRMHARLSGLVPLAATSCRGEWLMYGPRMGGAPGSTRTATWLHRLRFVDADSVEVQSMWTDTVPEYLSAGLPYGAVTDGDDVFVRHRGGARTRVLRVPCGAGEPRVVHSGESPERAALVSTPDGRTRTSVATGMRAPAGMAAFGGGVAFGEKVVVSNDHPRVDFTLLTNGKERTLSVSGDYVLHDSDPAAGVLVSTSDPVPQLFLVTPNDFARMFPAP